MKKLNFILLVGSSIFALIIIEVSLRTFSIYPINNKSNRIIHDKLGHMMSFKLKGIDNFGFRNENLESVEIVALGDSHTYGVNVISDNSWPKILGRMMNKNVYNFGVGGYGILQYQFLLHDAIEMKPEFIILGLYLPNDLNDVCRQFKYNEYWKARANELGINFKLCPPCEGKTSQSKAGSTKSNWFSFKKWAKYNVATVSLLFQHYLQYTINKKTRKDFIINDDKVNILIDFARINALKNYMDLEKAHIKMGLAVAKHFLLDAKRKTLNKEIIFGVLLIPSKELVSYNYLRDNGYRIPDTYHKLVSNEKKLKGIISSFLTDTGIPFKDVLPYMENALKEYGNIYPAGNNGHPLENGYRIYATTAFDLITSIHQRSSHLMLQSFFK